MNELDDKAKKNSSWLDKAELAYRQLNELHDDSGRFGPSRELDIALGLRSGPLELLTRALQGNEKIADGLSAAERKHQLAQAERGFRFLVRELAARLPEKVIGEPGGPKPAPRTDGEKAYADLTGGLARFLEVIGEEEKAIAVLDHLI